MALAIERDPGAKDSANIAHTKFKTEFRRLFETKRMVPDQAGMASTVERRIHVRRQRAARSSLS
jgi:hypothetical protein